MNLLEVSRIYPVLQSYSGFLKCCSRCTLWLVYVTMVSLSVGLSTQVVSFKVVTEQTMYVWLCFNPLLHELFFNFSWNHMLPIGNICNRGLIEYLYCSFPMVRSFVRLFVRSYVRSIFRSFVRLFVPFFPFFFHFTCLLQIQSFLSFRAAGHVDCLATYGLIAGFINSLISCGFVENWLINQKIYFQNFSILRWLLKIYEE